MPTISPKATEYSPLLISASRAMDIPAFHGQWLMERLRAGFVDKFNPYSHQPQRIYFNRAKAIIFWTKNPAPLLPHLPEIIDLGLTPLFLYSLNDYEAEKWEPNLPPLAKRLESFIRLARLLPLESVSWRFDPIALGGSLGPYEIVERIKAIHQTIGPWAGKLIFSFVDIYPKVRRRLGKLGLELREPDRDEKLLILKGLAEMKMNSPAPLSICACAEADDLNRFGLERSSCIDAPLLARLRPELAHSPELFAQNPASAGLWGRAALKPLKDKGQRRHCRCAPSRDIGTYGLCGHGCVYCYANR